MSLSLTETELPLRLRPERALTDEELLRFCKENEPMRVERDATGELILMSPTWTDTSNKNGYLTYQIFKWVEETNSGVAFDSNGGFTLPDGSMRSPDAAWISWQVWNALPPEGRQGYARICPQFVVELCSASDVLSELREKMDMWIANGAEVAWMIDPIEKAVTIYRTREEPDRRYDPTSVQGTGPVEGFELVMARIWG
jgi:Uma2 family endonuclease